ncbi:MAG: metallophosphoesterase [Prevotellaceae bacterium]|jgi:predicted MPP superfamily phosphohydrolase|nr:metallophosphoesterase [Prevotellaceae bacterium]
MKNIAVILSLIVLLSMIVGAVIYLSNRFALFFPSVSHKVLMWGLVAVMTVAFTGVLAFTTTANPVGKAVFMFGAIVATLFIFTLLSVAVVDLFNLIFKFSPQVRGMFAVILSAVLTVYGVWNAYNLKVREVTITVQGLSHEIRAVHISDLHLGNFRGKRQLEKVVETINKLNPDIVFNTGDMFDSKAHFSKGNDVLAAFRKLKMPHYFVYGNHDEHVGLNNVVSRMKNANATVLQNETARFGELQIIGLNNMLANVKSFDVHATDTSQTIENALNNINLEDNLPTIVLHHRPDGVDYMQQKGANLLLAGHTHAGQIFPFTFIAKWMFGYNSGLYKYKTMDIYVSEGAGTIFAPARLGTRSELTLVRLVPKNFKDKKI